MDDDDIEKKKITTSSGGGYKPLLDDEVSPKTQTLGETIKEIAERQHLARKAELTYTKEDYARWERNRERMLADRKTEVPTFDLDEVLANPELDAIKPTNIDPASMLADDIESLAKEGKAFINNPTLAGAASMAVVAIPGKYADKLFEKSDFFKSYEFNAPSGIKQNVYQQEIDWGLGVNTRNGVKTNLELASEGRSPFVIQDGKYSQINLHHSKQNSKGSLFELSAKTHQQYYGTNSLHPYLPNKHPINPVDRDSFDLDREAYWIERANNEMKKR